MDVTYLSRRLRQPDADRTPEGLSTFVEAADEESAARKAKLDLIARGRTPDNYPVFVDDYGDGTFEVVFYDRPLRPGQGFLSTGQRYGSAGSKADPIR